MLIPQVATRLLFCTAFVTALMFGCSRATIEPSNPEHEFAQEESRSYFMGFTPFPWDISLEAVTETNRFIVENGDIVSHHLEQGVPWTEALENKPFHPRMMDDWEGRRKVSANSKVFLSVTPLNGGRSGMSLYRGEDEEMPIPNLFKDKALNDPIIKKAYLNYCRSAAEFFQPDYFAIGIEVNELFHNSRQMWNPFLELYMDTYAELKKDYPDLPIFATVTLHNLTNTGWENLQEQQSEIKKFLEHNDIAGISYYPFMAGQSERPIEMFDWIREFTDKPLAITETGFPAEDIILKTYNVEISGTPEKQTIYFETLLDRASQDNYLFVIAFLHRDYDALWEKIKNMVPEAFIVWKDCGLVDENGVERPALDVWKRYFSETGKKSEY